MACVGGRRRTAGRRGPDLRVNRGRLGRAGRMAGGRRAGVAARHRGRDVVAARLLGPDARVPRPHCGLGGGDPPGAHARRHRHLPRRDAGAGGADAGDPPRLRHPRACGRGCGGSGARRGRGRDRAALARRARASCRSAALRRDGSVRGRAARPRAAAIGDAHVPVGFPGSEDRRPRRPRRQRYRPVRRPAAPGDHARSAAAGVHGAALRGRRQAVRAARAARPRPEVQRRRPSRRWTGSVARPGRRRRHASRRPCATWPRSC